MTSSSSVDDWTVVTSKSARRYRHRFYQKREDYEFCSSVSSNFQTSPFSSENKNRRNDIRYSMAKAKSNDDDCCNDKDDGRRQNFSFSSSLLCADCGCSIRRRGGFSSSSPPTLSSMSFFPSSSSSVVLSSSQYSLYEILRVVSRVLEMKEEIRRSKYFSELLQILRRTAKAAWNCRHPLKPITSSSSLSSNIESQSSSTWTNSQNAQGNDTFPASDEKSRSRSSSSDNSTRLSYCNSSNSSSSDRSSSNNSSGTSNSSRDRSSSNDSGINTNSSGISNSSSDRSSSSNNSSSSNDSVININSCGSSNSDDKSEFDSCMCGCLLLICLGFGSLTSSSSGNVGGISSRYQIAMFLLLKEILKISNDRFILREPMMSITDRRILGLLGLSPFASSADETTIEEKEEEGKEVARKRGENNNNNRCECECHNIYYYDIEKREIGAAKENGRRWEDTTKTEGEGSSSSNRNYDDTTENEEKIKRRRKWQKINATASGLPKMAIDGSHPVLLMMPHCDASLYGNVLFDILHFPFHLFLCEEEEEVEQEKKKTEKHGEERGQAAACHDDDRRLSTVEEGRNDCWKFISSRDFILPLLELPQQQPSSSSLLTAAAVVPNLGIGGDNNNNNIYNNSNDSSISNRKVRLGVWRTKLSKFVIFGNSFEDYILREMQFRPFGVLESLVIETSILSSPSVFFLPKITPDSSSSSCHHLGGDDGCENINNNASSTSSGGINTFSSSSNSSASSVSSNSCNDNNISNRNNSISTTNRFSAAVAAASSFFLPFFIPEQKTEIFVISEFFRSAHLLFFIRLFSVESKLSSFSEFPSAFNDLAIFRFDSSDDAGGLKTLRSFWEKSKRGIGEGEWRIRRRGKGR